MKIVYRIVLKKQTHGEYREQNKKEHFMKTFIRPFVILITTISYTTQPMELTQIIKPTPKEYYFYECLHSSYRLREWDKKKQNIELSLAQANNNQELIKEITNKPELGKTGYTPLCRAIEMNDFAFTQFLLDHEAKVNGIIRGVHSSKPIHFAQTLEMVQLLERNGADIFVYNEGMGYTRSMNLLHAALHPGSGQRDDRLVAYLHSLGFKLEDIVLEEDKDTIDFYCAQVPELVVRTCCNHRLLACLERIKKLDTQVS